MRSTRALVVLALLATMLSGHARAGVVYRQPVWFNWNESELTILVFPPGHGQIVNGKGILNGFDPDELSPYESSYFRAVTNSIEDWERAIETYAPAWLRNGLERDIFVVGRDHIPQSALDDPDIAVVSDEHQVISLGVAVHVGRFCVVDNGKLFTSSFTYEDMFNISSQEYGHCLGLGHVNEAIPANPPDDENIIHDPMNGRYPHPPGAAYGTELHCVSNLNVEGLEEVYRQVLRGFPGARDGLMPRNAYERVSGCS
ncbi:MAG TPA: hypothetical protein VGB83_12945 [Actinomycetota bacterium]